MCGNYAERVAKLVLEKIFPGSSMCYRRDQSHGEWDFDLKYQNGEIAAVEVTTSHNQAITQIHSEIFNQKKGGSRIQAVQCKLTWLIRPDIDANIKAIRAEADGYLAKLESEGISEFSAIGPPRRYSSECVTEIVRDLRLTYGKAIETEGEPEIRMLGVLSGGAVGPRLATEAAENEFEPNKKKLGRAQCKDRHLVVNIDQMNGGPWIAMADFAPPQEIPKLPEELTHIWLVAQTASDQFIVWSGSLDRPWQKTNLSGLSVRN